MTQRDFLNKANRPELGDLSKIKSLNNFKKDFNQNHAEEKKLSEKIKQTIQMMHT